MPEDFPHSAFEISTEALPAGAFPAPRPEAAHIFAVGIGDRASPRGYTVMRQRRTAATVMIIGWECDPADTEELAQTVEALAKDRGAILIRATPELTGAIDALALVDTGRGYAQRWLGVAIESAHDTGRFTQTTGFTCGPVSLAMAMTPEVNRSLEVEIWREATTMIGLTGPGGCDPYGLALAAARREFEVALWFDASEAVLLDRANTDEKKELMRFVQAEFREKAQETLLVLDTAMTEQTLSEVVGKGAQVLLLIDQCHTHDHHAPHWILVHAEQDGIFLVNDPWAEPDDGETVADVDAIPIARGTLMQMAAYGDPAYHAAIVLEKH